MITKRATHIKRLVDELADLTINSMFVRMHAYSCQPGEEEKHVIAQQYVKRKKANMMACLCEILENNDEQTEALLKELGLHWVDDAPVPPPPIKSENENNNNDNTDDFGPENNNNWQN